MNGDDALEVVLRERIARRTKARVAQLVPLVGKSYAAHLLDGCMAELAAMPLDELLKIAKQSELICDASEVN